MALADIPDVEARLGRPLTEPETAKAPGLLEEASILVVGYLGCDPTDPEADPPVPDAVRIVVSRMVARVIEQEGASQDAPIGATTATESAGALSRTFQFSSGSLTGAPWLTAADKTALRPYRCGGGMRSVSIRSDLTGRYRVRG